MGAQVFVSGSNTLPGLSKKAAPQRIMREPLQTASRNDVGTGASTVLVAVHLGGVGVEGAGVGGAVSEAGPEPQAQSGNASARHSSDDACILPLSARLFIP